MADSPEFKAALKQCSDAILRFTYPLLVEDDRGEPNLLASCVFVRVGSHIFLLTAAHALRNRFGRGLMTRGPKKVLPIGGDFLLTKGDSSDMLDVAALKFSPELAIENNISVVEPDMLATNWEVSNPGIRAIAGYPIRRNKPFHAVDRKSKIYNATAAPYFGSAIFDGDFTKFGKSPNLHIGLNYLPGSDETGKFFSTMPSPRGMSGGGAWLIPDVKAPEHVLLEGIFIECHDGQYCFSTRLEHAMQFALVSDMEHSVHSAARRE